MRQRKWIDGEILQQQAEYWKKTLPAAPAVLELPMDHPRPAQQDFRAASPSLELDGELTAELKALSKRHHTTLYITLLAAWAALLSRLSGQPKVVIGSPVANRGRTEIEPLIGFFVNTLALPVSVLEKMTVAELLAQVSESTMAAQQNQDIPFEQVVELMQPVRSRAHTPLFQAVFSWQNTAEGTLEMPGLELKPLSAAGSKRHSST